LRSPRGNRFGSARFARRNLSILDALLQCGKQARMRHIATTLNIPAGRSIFR